MRVVHDDCRVSRRAVFKIEANILGHLKMCCTGCGDHILYHPKTKEMKYLGAV